jgi:hypothetical protein
MRINWLGTAAIALILGTGSAFAQQSDLQRRDEGGTRSALPSKGAERPAVREERPGGAMGGMNDRAAQREGGAMEPRRSEGPASREQAQDRQLRDKQPTRQSQDQIGREHSTVGEAQQNRQQGREDQNKPDNRARDTTGNATESRQQGQQQPGRGERQTTGTAQQSQQEPKKGREAERTTGQKGRDTDRGAEQKGADANRSAEQKQTGRDRNNQAAQPPSSTENQAGRQPQNQPQATGQAGQRDTTGQAQNQSAGRSQTTSSVKVSDQQRTQVIDRLRRDRDIDQARTNVNIHVSVGERLPDRVRPRPLPADIVSIAPEYRGYEYTVIEDQVTIVDPRSREIVDIIPERGFMAESGSYRSRTHVSLSTEQRDLLRREALSAGSTTVGSTAGGGGGQTCLSLRPVPQDLARDNPDLASYSYVAIGDQIVLVDPRDRRIVVDVIDQDNR